MPHLSALLIKLTYIWFTTGPIFSDADLQLVSKALLATYHRRSHLILINWFISDVTFLGKILRYSWCHNCWHCRFTAGAIYFIGNIFKYQVCWHDWLLLIPHLLIRFIYRWCRIDWLNALQLMPRSFTWRPYSWCHIYWRYCPTVDATLGGIMV